MKEVGFTGQKLTYFHEPQPSCSLPIKLLLLSIPHHSTSISVWLDCLPPTFYQWQASPALAVLGDNDSLLPGIGLHFLFLFPHSLPPLFSIPLTLSSVQAAGAPSTEAPCYHSTAEKAKDERQIKTPYFPQSLTLSRLNLSFLIFSLPPLAQPSTLKYFWNQPHSQLVGLGIIWAWGLKQRGAQCNARTQTRLHNDLRGQPHIFSVETEGYFTDVNIVLYLNCYGNCRTLEGISL